MTEPIPLVDLGAQHRALRAEIDAAFARVLESSGFILGGEVERFEADFARYLGAAHAVGVASGTDALHLSLRALGVGPGDEVIVPAFTFVATAAAVLMAGATPVLADIDPGTFHLDPDSARARVGPRTRAVIVVHLYGQGADLAPFQALCREHRLWLVEDACQAHGARLPDGRRAGTGGDAGCFSFYPSKNLGALGDGGLVVTERADLAETIRILRHQGQGKRYQHLRPGYASRLDGLQAAVLGSKLEHLERWNDERRCWAEAYHRQLKDTDLVLPRPAPGHDHVYHVYVVRHPDRDALRAHLERQGIATAVHYPSAVHQQPAFASLATPGLGEAERAGRQVLSLPMYPELGEERVARVAAAVRTLGRRGD
jgi:dTDP-4-amino-4,6-dideoxygalactose transaminase